MYYGTVWSAVVHTNFAPLRENPRLEPRFPDARRRVGWEVSFSLLCGGAGRRGRPRTEPRFCVELPADVT